MQEVRQSYTHRRSQLQQQLASLHDTLNKVRTYKDEQEARLRQLTKELDDIQHSELRQEKTVLASEQLAAIKKTQNLSPVPPKGPKPSRK